MKSPSEMKVNLICNAGHITVIKAPMGMADRPIGLVNCSTCGRKIVKIEQTKESQDGKE